MKTLQRFGVALFFFFSTLIAHVANSSTAGRFEVFHLKKGAHFVYDFKGTSFGWSFFWSGSIIDSGVVSYTIGDSLVVSDTTVAWSITETLDLRRRRVNRLEDTSFVVRQPSVLTLYETTIRNHELRDTALLWMAPTYRTRLFRYADSLVGGYCMIAPANFDSFRISSDSSLTRRSYSTCDDHDEWGSYLWRRGRLRTYQVLSVSPRDLLPEKVYLYQNYPNPFNPVTTIGYALPAALHLSLKVFDLLGREVATLMNKVKQPGTHTVTWDASGFSSGVYFYRLSSGTFTDVKRLILLR